MSVTQAALHYLQVMGSVPTTRTGNTYSYAVKDQKRITSAHEQLRDALAAEYQALKRHA